MNAFNNNNHNNNKVPLLLLVVSLLAVLVGAARAGYDDRFALSNELDGSVPGAKQQQQQQRTPDDAHGRQSNALYCHTCSSLKHGDTCSHLAPNASTFSSQCPVNHTVCMVKRFSVTENATSPSVLWSIERNCSAKCEPGCLILGERTKIHVCVSCCTHSSCNTGNGATGAVAVTTATLAAQLALSVTLLIAKSVYATLLVSS